MQLTYKTKSQIKYTTTLIRYGDNIICDLQKDCDALLLKPIPYLVNVEDEIKLANVVEVFIKNFDEIVDCL